MHAPYQKKKLDISITKLAPRSLRHLTHLHVEQKLAPADDDELAGQEMQLEEPIADWYWPLEHTRQSKTKEPG